ncbi:MAG: hypothetical protein KJ822_12435, partial [Proteobacteria bacterium]|nr:hypothetical protein [Pseudomonadota bacterium]
ATISAKKFMELLLPSRSQAPAWERSCRQAPAWQAKQSFDQISVPRREPPWSSPSLDMAGNARPT